MHQTPLQGMLKPDITTQNAGSTRVRGTKLLVMRVVWWVLTLFNLAVFFVSIPAYYHQLFMSCINPQQGCNLGQLTPGNLEALHQLGLSLGDYAAYALTASIIASSVFLVVGLLLFWRRSDEWTPVLASLVLIIFASDADARAGALALLPSSYSLFPIGAGILVSLGYPLLGLFFSLFPTGRAVPRWAWTLVFLWVAQIVPWVMPPDSPYYIWNWPPLVFALEQLVMWGSALGVQLYRYMLISDQVQRQQSKWLIFGFALALLIDVPYYGLPGIFPALAVPTSPYQVFNILVWELFLIFIPLAIGIAILRYRLWDIDLIINRTLVYGTLTISLALVYFGLVVVLQSLVQALTGVAGQQPLVTVASTLAIAALFQPLRRGIQSIIDRRFYRRKYDAARTLAAFSATLRNEVDLNQLSEQLVAVVQETMQPTHVSLWIRPLKWQASGGRIRAESSSPVEERPEAIGFDS